MGVIQKILMRLAPSQWAKSAEAESQAWRITCSACGASQSVWERGGVRWKAAGRPRMRLKCASCGKTVWHNLVKVED